MKRKSLILRLLDKKKVTEQIKWQKDVIREELLEEKKITLSTTRRAKG